MNVLWVALKGAAAHLWFSFLAIAAIVAGHLSLTAVIWVLLFTATALRASVKARNTEVRLNAHIVATAPAIALQANGGAIGGDLLVNGKHTTTGNINTGANLNVGGINAAGTIVPMGSPGLSMQGNIAMNGHNAYGGGTYT